MTYINICQWIITFVVISRKIEDLNLICFKASYFCFLLALNRFFEISLRTLLVIPQKNNYITCRFEHKSFLVSIFFFLKDPFSLFSRRFRGLNWNLSNTGTTRVGKYFCQTLPTFDCDVLFIKTLPLLKANCHGSKYRKLTFKTDLPFDRNK